MWMLLVIIATGAQVSIMCAAEGSGVDGEQVALSQQLLQDDTLRRDQVLRHIKGTTDSLLQIAKQQGGDGSGAPPRRQGVLSDRYWRAVSALVELRDVHVIPILVRDVDERSQLVITTPLKLGPYRNAASLVNFGDAAGPEILRHLRTKRFQEVTDRQIELYGRVLEETYSLSDDEHRLTDVLSLVRTTRERSHKKENLDRLILQLEKMRRGERPQF